jgi:hypothetical protein
VKQVPVLDFSEAIKEFQTAGHWVDWICQPFTVNR